MKFEDKWKPTKYIFKDGKYMSDEKYVGFRSKIIADKTAKVYARFIPEYAKGDLLDLGCGTVPFYNLYKQYVSSITCADWENCEHDISHIDFFVDLNKDLKIKNNSYDTILLTDVLEHIYEPKKLLKQLYNILRDDGILIINTPFAYWEHEVPFDYFRYTEFFYQKVAEELGFKVEVIQKIGNGFDTIRDILSKLYESRPSFAIKFLLKMVKIVSKKFPVKLDNEPLSFFVVFKKTNS